MINDFANDDQANVHLFPRDMRSKSIKINRKHKITWNKRKEKST